MGRMFNSQGSKWFSWEKRSNLFLFLIQVIAYSVLCSVLISCSPFASNLPTTKGTATLSPSVVPPVRNWTSLLKEVVPGCTNTVGVVWQALPGTLHTCARSVLIMQQNSLHSYAENDLDKVGGTTYNQQVFRVEVTAMFQKPKDTTTNAALLVQTPQALGVAGGYILTLNAIGNWQLQEVISGTNIPSIKLGNVHINPTQTNSMIVVVEQGRIYCAINNHWIVSYPDTLNPTPGAVALLVERNGGLSSPVAYSNFGLDQ